MGIRQQSPTRRLSWNPIAHLLAPTLLIDVLAHLLHGPTAEVHQQHEPLIHPVVSNPTDNEKFIVWNEIQPVNRYIMTLISAIS
jgi:hypothetical protein